MSAVNELVNITLVFTISIEQAKVVDGTPLITIKLQVYEPVSVYSAGKKMVMSALAGTIYES